MNTNNRPSWKPSEPSTVSVSTLLQYSICPLRGVFRQKHPTVKSREDVPTYIGVAVHAALAVAPEHRARAISWQMDNVTGAFGSEEASQAKERCHKMVSWATHEFAMRGYRLSKEKVFRRPHHSSNQIIQSQVDGYCLEGDGTPVVVEYKTGSPKTIATLSPAVDFQTLFSCWTALKSEVETIRRVVLFLGAKQVYTDLLRAPALDGFVAQQNSLLKAFAKASASPTEVKARPGNHCNHCDFASRCLFSTTKLIEKKV